ncbi:hypothetical protein GCM10027030_16930 [Luteococcus sediminum]
MLHNAILSLAAGGLLSLLAFVPVVVWQHRRYGEVAEIRLGLIGALLVYCSALFAYTMFPLPNPDTVTEAWCASRQHLNTDPRELVRRVRAAHQGVGWRQALVDHRVLELLLNVALFVPLGWFCRRFGGWRVLPTLATGLLVSLAIEVTQYTGLWGIFRCAYRMSDAVDLVTNTTGTAVGILLAALTPRFFPRAEVLEANAHRARPVNARRRWLGQVLDGACFVLLQLVGFVSVAMVEFALGHSSTQVLAGAERILMLVTWPLALACCLVAATGDGSSPGQRTTFLRPVRGQDRPARWRRLVRPFVVFFPVAVLVFGQPTELGRWVGLAWGLVALVWTGIDPHGLSARAVGLRFADARRQGLTRTTTSAWAFAAARGRREGHGGSG